MKQSSSVVCMKLTCEVREQCEHSEPHEFCDHKDERKEPCPKCKKIKTARSE